MAQYPHLPGIEVSVRDGGLIIPNEGTTESMLVIASTTKVDAPEEPRLVRQSLDVEGIFGPYVDNTNKINEVAASWKMAHEGGNRLTYLLALKGETEKEKFLNLYNMFFGILADFSVDNVVLRDVYADREAGVLEASDFTNPEDVASFPNIGGILRYAYVVESSVGFGNQTKIEVGDNDGFIINDGAQDHELTLAAGDYSLEELAQELENTIKAVADLENFVAVVENGRILILGDKEFTYKAGTAGDASATLRFTPGSVGVRKRHESGKIYIGNFAELLKDYCENQTINHNTVKGYIGVTAPTSYSLGDIKNYVDKLAVLDNEYSGHVSVVAGPELGYQIPGRATPYYTNGVVSYAALVSTLPAESSPTNKPVSGIAGIAYNLSLRQLNALSGNKFVSFRFKNGGVYVTDGVTTAPDLLVGGLVQKSDFTRLSTLRITHAAINLVREVADPFVGEPAGMAQRNALNAAIKSGLEKMKEAGAIQDYRFSIIQERGAGVLGQSRITLQLVPAFETKKIAVDISLVPLLQGQE